MTNLLIGFTLPKTRRVLWRLIRHHGLVMLQLIVFVAWFVLVWPEFRGVMDDVHAPRYGAGLESQLFGGLPTIWLQELYGRWQGLAWASVAIHGSWFVVPWLAVAAVLVKEPRRAPSLLRWWFALLVVCLPAFALFPMEPPWMADSDVIRVNATIVGAIPDNNPFAAMPSLHVALPAVLALWFFRERWLRAGQVMLAYSMLVALEVVFSGEHYVIDVVGATAVAGLVAVLARFDYSPAIRLLTSRLARPPFQRERPIRKPALPGALGGERAQALIEFAFIAPVMFVLLFAIVDFSIAIDRRVMLQHAVREGARYGAVHENCPDIVTRTLDQAQDIDDVAVDVSYPDGGDVGERVKVAADFTWEFPIFSELGGVFGVGPLSIDLTPSGTARLEHSVAPATGCSGSS